MTVANGPELGARARRRLIESCARRRPKWPSFTGAGRTAPSGQAGARPAARARHLPFDRRRLIAPSGGGRHLLCGPGAQLNGRPDNCAAQSMTTDARAASRQLPTGGRQAIIPRAPSAVRASVRLGGQARARASANYRDARINYSTFWCWRRAFAHTGPGHCSE